MDLQLYASLMVKSHAEHPYTALTKVTPHSTPHSTHTNRCTCLGDMCMDLGLSLRQPLSQHTLQQDHAMPPALG